MIKILFDSSVWQEIYQVLSKNKFRTMITIIGVLWGVFLLVTLLGLAKGVENKFNSEVGGLATNSVFIQSKVTGMPFGGYQEGRPVRMLESDVNIIKNQVEGIKYIVPRNMSVGQVNYKFKSDSYKISADYPLIGQVTNRELLFGRFLNKTDMQELRKVVVISEDMYQDFFEIDQNPIGEYIEINNINFKVVGVFNVSKNNWDDMHIPFATYQQLFNQGNRISWMMITGEEENDILQIEKDVKLQLKNLHGVHPEDTRAFGSFNLGDLFKKIKGFLFALQFLTYFVGYATLIAGVFAIGNILLITVRERTKEIGIRRAIGAKPFEIKIQIILESVVLTLIAGSFGIIFGACMLKLANMFLSTGENAAILNASVNIPIILTAVLILIFLGTFIGLIPANRAVRIKPIDALRDE